jgi:hypothetical protein
MAWIVVDLDDTLIQDMGDGQEVPIAGSVESMMQLANEGHRLTVFTSRFVPMPDSEKQRLKEQIEQDLVAYGFPPMEVWTGTSKPAADVFIDNKAVTFDGDWPLALAQLSVMLEERGLAPGPQPDDGSLDGIDPGGEQPPPEQDPNAQG